MCYKKLNISCFNSNSISVKNKLIGEARGRRPQKQLQKSFSTESSLNHMVPNSPVYADDVAMGDNSRDSSPTKGNRKLSPPKYIEAPIVEVTENESSDERNEKQANEGNNRGGKVEGIYSIIICVAGPQI